MINPRDLKQKIIKSDSEIQTLTSVELSGVDLVVFDMEKPGKFIIDFRKVFLEKDIELRVSNSKPDYKNTFWVVFSHVHAKNDKVRVRISSINDFAFTFKDTSINYEFINCKDISVSYWSIPDANLVFKNSKFELYNERTEPIKKNEEIYFNTLKVENCIGVSSVNGCFKNLNIKGGNCPNVNFGYAKNTYDESELDVSKVLKTVKLIDILGEDSGELRLHGQKKIESIIAIRVNARLNISECKVLKTFHVASSNIDTLLGESVDLASALVDLKKVSLTDEPQLVNWSFPKGKNLKIDYSEESTATIKRLMEYFESVGAFINHDIFKENYYSSLHLGWKARYNDTWRVRMSLWLDGFFTLAIPKFVSNYGTSSAKPFSWLLFLALFYVFIGSLLYGVVFELKDFDSSPLDKVSLLTRNALFPYFFEYSASSPLKGILHGLYSLMYSIVLWHFIKTSRRLVK